MSLAVSMALFSGGLGRQISTLGQDIGNSFLNNLISRTSDLIPSVASITTGGTSLPASARHQKAVLQNVMRQNFLQGWQWSVAAEGLANIDVFCKDITYHSTEIETETKQIGSVEFNSPIYKVAGAISMTLKSNQNRVIENWFDALAKKAVNPDGTVNLTRSCAISITVHTLLEDGGSIPAESFYVFAKARGETTLSREDVGVYYTTPVTFVKVTSGYTGVSGAIASAASGVTSSVGSLAKF